MAGNARFHDKFHRKNHHTNPTAGFADSATDPIASPSEPFQGDFSLNGKLSASSSIDVLSANIRHDVYCENIHVADVTYTNYISGNSTEAIISDGSLVGSGNNTLTLDFQTGIYARTPSYNLSNRLSVNGFSKLSGVNVNDVVYLSHPTYGSVDTLVQDATLTVRSNTDSPVNIITSDNSNSNNIKTYKSRGTLATKTSVSADDTIFGIKGYAHNGTNYNEIAKIIASSEGNQTSSNGGGYLTLHTSPSTTTNSLSERVRVTGFGNVGIGELGSKTGSTSATVEIAAGAYGGPSSSSLYNGRALSLLGGKSDRVFTQFYANSANQTERSGWIGFGSAANRNLTINNELSASLDLRTQNLTRLSITSAGDVGIGFTNPAFKLDVNGDISGTNFISTSFSTTETALYLIRAGAPTDQKAWQSIHLSDGVFKIRTVDDAYTTKDDAFVATRLNTGIGINSVSLGTNFNTRLHIISSGKVGIGTTDPKGDLHIKNATDPKYASIVLGSNTADGFHITNETNGNGLGFWTGTFGYGTNRLRILTGGNVGINTVNPTQKLHVEGNIYANGNISTTGNLYVQGNLSALGDMSIIDTNIISTSSLSVLNHGTTEALLVNQIGNYPTAKFQKDGADILVIQGTGTNVTVYNTLTAKDYISSPNINLLQATSSNWDTTYNTVYSTSSRWMTGGDSVEYKLNKLTVIDTVSTTNVRVINSMYLPVSSGLVVSATDTQLEIYDKTYLFMNTDGSTEVNLRMPDVDSRHVGLMFYIRNMYSGSSTDSDIKIKNFIGSDLYYISKIGKVPNIIQLIWDGTQWQQILLV